MKSLRNLVGVVMAFALAAFALPSIAGNKTFDLAATPSVGVNQSIVVTLTNRDDGNSTFNSLRITGAPGTGATLEIVSASQTGSNKPGNYTISTDKKSITYTDLSPIKPQNPISVTLVVRTSTPSCSNGSIQWTGSAWTGSPSTPSNPFTTQDSPVTSISFGSCGIKFETPPKKALKDQLITSAELDPTAAKVKVSVTVNGAAPASATDVTLTSSCAPGSMAPGSYTKTMAGGVGSVEFDNLKSSSTATGCTLKATTSALNPTNYSATSGSFDVVDADVVITGLPTSFALNTSTPIGAKLVIKGTTTLVPQNNGAGTLTIAGQCTPTSLTVANQNGGLISFGNVSGSTVGGTCSFTATATFNGVTYTSANYGPYLVFKSGGLDCGNTDPMLPSGSTLTSYQFDGSVGVNDIELESYYKGARGANIIDVSAGKTTPCYLVNYTLANNVEGTVDDILTIPGKKIPQNAVALFWDDIAQPNATFKTVTTYRDEWTNASGWVAKRTKVCLDNACNDKAPLKACLGTSLVLASMPFFDAPNATTKMPVCVVAEAWATVPVALCTDPDPQPNANSACIRVTSELIVIQDPIMPREP